MPHVSIVIPTYNHERYLKEAIDSALNQTYRDIEVIVVDDGSTDSTPEICKGYEEAIKYIHKPNGGPASALNTGIQNMKGLWFKWLSSDDVLLPAGVEHLVNYAKQTGGEFLYGNFYYIDPAGNVTGQFVEPRRETYEDIAKTWGRFFGNGSTSMIHTSIFDRVGWFDESLRFGEDMDFWTRCIFLHKIMLYGCPEFIIKYRMHPEQLTNKVDYATNDQAILKRIKEEMQG